MILFYVQMLEKFTHHLHFKQDQDSPLLNCFTTGEMILHENYRYVTRKIKKNWLRIQKDSYLAFFPG